MAKHTYKVVFADGSWVRATLDPRADLLILHAIELFGPDVVAVQP